MSGPLWEMAVCRDCAAALRGRPVRCPECRSRRVVAHPELHDLPIAHLDADAFYASVEKRDRPELVARPVIVGGDHRGVVAACCYVARMSGVRSAMPIHQALDRCPDAVVLQPDMDKYRRVGHRMREIMESFTPLVEPISIDEAYLDLSGVRALLAISPAQAVAEIARRVEYELGITVSIGLAPNKALAKLMSDTDKPRGFAVLGRGEAAEFLAPKPVSVLWGVGPALTEKLATDGIRRVGDLLGREEIQLVRRYGVMGSRLYAYARGHDDRRVEPEGPSKSISAETTFDWDTAEPGILRHELRALAETVARRMGAERVRGRSVVLKLKASDFRQTTRSRRVDPAVADAAAIWRTGCDLLAQEADGRAFRLLGIGCAELIDPAADPEPDLFASAGPG